MTVRPPPPAAPVPDPLVPDPLVRLAHRLAEAARPVIRQHFRSRVAVDDKADASPVTVADREAETAMRRILEAEVPDHGIIGEEHGRVREGASHVWVLDPIDGTKAFITGKPIFGTLIALLQDGQPVLGIIDQAILGERWAGVAGRGTTFNGAAVRVRPCPSLAQATVNATSPLMFRGADLAAYERVRDAAKLPHFGGDCYAYGLLASGFIDLCIEASMQLYDYAALVPVIQGAGGTIGDWRGRPLDMDSDGTVMAAGDARVHREAVALLAG